MKIPKEILGIHKVRDAGIVKLYSEGYSCEEIKEKRKLDLTVRRIQQIVYTNRAFVKINRDFEEVQQINRIKQKIRAAGASKRDVYDWEVLLDNKITPKKIEHSGKIGETNIVIIRDGDKTQDVSGPIRIQSCAVSGDGGGMGNRQEHVSNLAGNVIQRADPEQPGDRVP